VAALEADRPKADPVPAEPLRFPDGTVQTSPVPPFARSCLLFAGHPGTHDFAYGVPGGEEEVRHPTLTVGEVRRAWQDLADETPVRIAAAGTGVLAENGAEVLLQATGEAWVQSFDVDGRPSGARTAAVLLAGLGELPTQDVAAPDGAPEPSDAAENSGAKSKVPGPRCSDRTATAPAGISPGPSPYAGCVSR
jgi:hypothetical protein